MKVESRRGYNSQFSILNSQSNCVATIGSFDGVHRGHQCLLSQVRGIADERGLNAVAVTFARSPRKVLGGSDMAPLNSIEERLMLLREMGMDDVCVLHFTREMAQMTARDFMRQVIKEQVGAEVLVIGYDHRFGCKRADGFDDYVRYGRELGIEVVRGEACLEGAEAVSSTRIRQCVVEGRVAEAAQLLGYNYRLCGEVVDGYKVGRKIGFPTANISVDDGEKLIPADGVYAVKCQQTTVNRQQSTVNRQQSTDNGQQTTVNGQRTTDDGWLMGMLNIGHRPTVNNGAERSIEVHILDFEGDLYGQPLCIEFVERLRDERSFASLDELMAQLATDRECVRKIIHHL